MSRLDETRNFPVFQKAELIYRLVESLVASLPEKDTYIRDTKTDTGFENNFDANDFFEDDEE